MKDSQINPYEHSDVKVKLLRLYLEKYINILALAKGIHTVEVYDFFCGEGIYNNGKEGSPVIILRLIKEIYYKSRKNSNVIFNCNFNDYNRQKTIKLSKYISEEKLHYPEIGELKFFNEDYQDIKNRIVQNKSEKGVKRFIFIDPYGYKNISVNDIKHLLSDKNTEVLLFLPTQFMYRFEKKSTPESLYNFLSEVMSEDELGMSDSGVDFIHKLRDGFGNKLKGNHYVDSFIITRNVNEFFALFFFTSHLYGFEKFLEAKWSIDEEEGRGWSPKFEEVDLFSNIEVEAKTDKFEEKLITFLSQSRSNIEIHHFTIENRHLTTHAVQILKKVQNSNNLIVNNVDSSKPRKGAFYIGWNEVKTNTIKSYIKYENNGTIKY